MSIQYSTRLSPVSILAVSSLLLLSLLIVIHHRADAKLLHKIQLANVSSTLSAILSIKYKGVPSAHFDLREHHSAWQQRSRIDYEAAGTGWAFSNTRGTFYAHKSRAYQVDRMFNRCTSVDIERINAAFKMDFASSNLNELPHMIGTIRLLDLIELHSHVFEPAASSNGDTGDTNNAEARGQYKYWAKLGELTISVAYAERALSLPLGVPSRVIVSRPDGYQLILRPMRVAPLEPMELVYGDISLPHGMRHSAAAAGFDLLFDAFAVPRDLDCTRDTAEDTEMTPVLANLTNYRFSFSARVSSQRNPTLAASTHVGYEPELETLRVGQQYERYTTQTWVSYRHDRIYNVLSRQLGKVGMSALDIILDLGKPVEPAKSISSCVVTKASQATRLTDTCRNPHSLGSMLFGAIKVVYMGLARVRGIEAHVFEAHDSQLPVWLEQPSVYHDQRPWGSEPSGLLKWRVNSMSANNNNNNNNNNNDDNNNNQDSGYRMRLNTVFYFSRSQSDRGLGNRLLADNKLLLIEIFKLSPFGIQLDKITIPVFGFTWRLETRAPNGQRWEDFYSLASECLAPSSDDTHNVRISFNLKAAPRLPGNTSEPHEESAQADWLLASVSRNLALMRAVHEQLGMAPTFVYNFESRQLELRARLIAASMLAAERQEAPVSLISMGWGTPAFVKFNKLPVTGFQMCYQLASHKGRDTLFAYNEIMPACYIYRLPITSANESSEFNNFLAHPNKSKLDSSSNFELYKILHCPERRLIHDNYITRLDEIETRFASAGRFILTEPTSGGLSELTLVENASEPSRAYFSLGQVQLDWLNEKRGGHYLDKNRLPLVVDVDKFLGLGLIREDLQNKLVENLKQDPRYELAMTFDKCHEACLIDAECRTFSTCIVAGRIECLLSSVNFNNLSIAQQLLAIRDGGSKSFHLGKQDLFKINLNESEPLAPEDFVNIRRQSHFADMRIVHIRKHLTCELRIKLYGNLFQIAQDKSLVSLRNRLIRPAMSSEECAEFCYLATLATMRKEISRLSKTLTTTTTTTTTTTMFNENKQELNLTNNFSAGHCGHYYYLNEQTLASSRATIPSEQEIIGMHTDGATRGYCLFDDGSLDAPVDPRRHRLPQVSDQSEPPLRASVAPTTFELHKYELDFSVMYEKEYGLSLLESEKSSEITRAYRKIYLEQEYTRENLDIMRAFIERGGNLGHRGARASPNARECARQCFTQLAPLWPACRSFEHYQIVEKITARRHNFCTFNTATLSELIEINRTDLVARNSSQLKHRIQFNEGDIVHVCHYEPRQGLVALSLLERYRATYDDQMGERKLGAHLNGGIIAGAFLQAHLSNRISEDNEMLFERTSGNLGKPK